MYTYERDTGNTSHKDLLKHKWDRLGSRPGSKGKIPATRRNLSPLGLQTGSRLLGNSLRLYLKNTKYRKD